jgi:RNA polymerase sigma-70 factor (ECF subfamily)
MIKKKANKDLELAKAIIDGNELVFNQFFTDYYPRLFRFIMSRVGSDKDLSDDFSQQTMCKTIDNLASFRGEAALFTWMCQISRSIIHAHFVKEKRRGKIVIPMADKQEVRDVLDTVAISENQQPDKLVDSENLGQLISEVMDNLPNNYGDLLEWKYVEHLSVAQIAEKTNTSMISVQSSLARARKAFKSVMESIEQNRKIQTTASGTWKI